LKIEDGKFYLNGEEIIGDTGKKCIAAYAAHYGDSPVEMKLLQHDNTTIHIIFD